MYGWTPDYCLKKLSLPQLILWYEVAMERNHGIQRKKRTSQHKDLSREDIREQVEQMKRELNK